MLSQLIKRLKAPVFEDEEKTRVAGMLNVILLAIFTLITLWLLIVPFISANPVAGFISLGITLLFTTGALIGLQRGYVQPVSILFVSASWLLVTVASYFFGGVNNPGIHAYLLVILIAGLLLGGRVAIGVAGLSIVSGLTMHYLRITGLLPASLIVHTSFEHWLILTINLVITSVLLYLATTTIQSGFDRARREIVERKQVELELSTLLEATKAVSSTLNLEEILALIARLMATAIDAAGCTLSRWDQEVVVTWIEWRSQCQEYADKPGTIYKLENFPTTRTVLETRQPETISITDPQADPAEVAHLRKMKYENLLMLPLTSGEQVIGLVEIHRIKTISPFTRAEISLCQALADQAAIAIENARLYQQAQQEITERQQVEAIRVKLEKQLRQAQKMEAIGTLAGGIAHDFNNMLTAIIGNTELALAMLPAENPVYQDLQSIRKVSERAANLVSQLLAFARSRFLELTPLNLNALIENSKETFNRLVGDHITIKLLLAPDLGRVEASAHHLEQVLVHLVVNARDALPVGGVITITTENITLAYNNMPAPAEIKMGEYVLLSVADNGVGMNKQVQLHIFDPFFTTKEVGQGVGLGLAVCFGIIKQHNGYIQVESAPNQGTTFQIYLPRVDESASEYQATPKKKTILFIEDDPSIRYISTRILDYHGYEIIEASNGVDALDIIQARHQEIDLLITDIMLPGMGGLELSDKLKKIQPGIKVLYTSGYAPSHFSQQELAAIDSAFLQKPYSPHTLVEIVKDLLMDD